MAGLPQLLPTAASGKVVTQLPYSGGRYWLRTRFFRPWRYRLRRRHRIAPPA